MEVSGKSDREIRDSLLQTYGIDVSVVRIHHVIRTVHERIRRWQERNLDDIYPVVHFDGIHPALTRYGSTGARHSYIAVAITLDGVKDVLGIWTTTGCPGELQDRILSELRRRGLRDMFLVFADHARHFRDAFNRHFPRTRVHAGIAGLIRDSLQLVPSTRRVQLGKDLKNVYQAPDLPIAEARLADLVSRWRETSPAFARHWQENWEMFAPISSLPLDIRRVICMLNVIESLNSALRKVMKNRRLFRSEEVLLRVFFLTLHTAAMKWPRSLRDWKATSYWLTETFHDRLPFHRT